MTPDTPGAKRRRILAFVRRYMINNYGIAPTVREITAGAGLSSTSVTTYHLEALAENGKIHRIPRSARGLALIDD